MSKGAVLRLLLASALALYPGCARLSPAVPLRLPCARVRNPAARAFQRALRRALSLNEPPPTGARLHHLLQAAGLPPRFHGLALVAYQPGRRRVLVLRRGKPEPALLAEVVARMRAHPRLRRFAVADPVRCRLQLDFMPASPRVVSMHAMSTRGAGPARFEPGLTGLRLAHAGRVAYFLPGDAYVRSILSVGQLRAWAKRAFPGVPPAELRCARFTTRSYVSHGWAWLPLERGMPRLGAVGREHLLAAARAAVALVVRTARPDGRFRYYYDAARDSERDHEHPRRDPQRNPYYNLVRHAGGCLMLLDALEAGVGDRRVRSCLRAGVKFLLGHLRYRNLSGGARAACVFANRKAKLGASGLALAVLARCTRLAPSPEYPAAARALAEHILSQARPDGEFFYYYVNPFSPPGSAENFSFYYPGEALTGLALYTRLLASRRERQRLRTVMHRCLGFLLHTRRRRYGKLFKPLPADAWLMQAVREIWELPPMRRREYRAFVFAQADMLLRHMYRPDHTPWPDAVGSFFYTYGDHPYPDGARCEGLLAALELARLTGNSGRFGRYLQGLQAASWATLHLVNTPESTYAVKRPDRAIGGIRFKFTRQWFRIDTIAHVAGGYLRFARYWPRAEYYYPYD